MVYTCSVIRRMESYSAGKLSFNLSRRLISIFLVSVLAVYTAGITVTLRLRRSAMQDWQAAYTAQAADFTDQLNTELLRIRTQMKYTLTRSVTLRDKLKESCGVRSWHGAGLL